MHACDQDLWEFILKIGKRVINLFKIPKNWKSNDICTITYGSTITDYDKSSNCTVYFATIMSCID